MLTKYNQTHIGTLGELLVTLVLVKQRPPNWEKEVERFIKQEEKNSFYLSKVFAALSCEDKYGFLTEKNRQETKRLAAISLAKHETGKMLPNRQQIESASKRLDGIADTAPKGKKVWRFIRPKRGK